MQANGVLRYALVRSRCEGAERHGNWLPWIKANPDFSEQTTSRIDEGGCMSSKTLCALVRLAVIAVSVCGLFLCAHTRLFAY